MCIHTVIKIQKPSVITWGRPHSSSWKTKLLPQTLSSAGATEKFTALVSPTTMALYFWNEKVLCYLWWHSLLLFKAVLSKKKKKKDMDTFPPYRNLIGIKVYPSLRKLPIAAVRNVIISDS